MQDEGRKERQSTENMSYSRVQNLVLEEEAIMHRDGAVK